MGKLSALPTETTFGLADLLVKVKAAGAGDVLVTLQNLINAIGPSTYNPYKFSVYLASNTSLATGAILPYDTKSFDTGSNIDIVTNKGRFTAPVAGFYHFNATAYVATPNGQAYLQLKKNGTAVKQGNITVSAAVNVAVNLTCVLSLSTNDYIEITVNNSGGTATWNGTSQNTYFDGFLVSAT